MRRPRGGASRTSTRAMIGAEVHLPLGGTKESRQRPPRRGGPGRARRVHRVEVDLRRLLRPAATRADRHRAVVEYRRLGDSDPPRLRRSGLGNADDRRRKPRRLKPPRSRGRRLRSASTSSTPRTSAQLGTLGTGCSGRALEGRPRDSYVPCGTKLRGNAPDGGKASREQVLRQIDESLERLGAEFVDLAQCFVGVGSRPWPLGRNARGG